ncbi:XAC2610-related protein [Dysgonomonas macrotermitis]|uniref:Lipoprotein n=1 Tax=Dysgonomonas macrotermitis TaxID=1346286 RepID=A0A1M4ZMQ0_9BACT|nr:hypothetical protein [Dysgonomonas macrotermitis]SHF19072.1 hypothetical protein SAMN05444362_104130 [Dysgonomonas macrotermitis]
MKKFFLLLLVTVFTTCSLFSQISYSGFIHKYPIQVVMYPYSDGVVNAFYAYDKYDEPIIADGRFDTESEELILKEKDKEGRVRATLTFEDYSEGSAVLSGTWKDTQTGNELNIQLTKSFDIGYGEELEWESKELLQSVSLYDKYFKIIISKQKDDFYAHVSGLKIFEKRTDKLLQYIELECQLMGINCLEVDDYNFDGVADFSVFEASYAGPNTSRLYFLFDPKTGEYFLSDIGGVSLDFDHEKKRIYEHNQCCAGRNHMNAEYKLVNNQMVLVKKTCVEYNEDVEDFIEVNCD